MVAVQSSIEVLSMAKLRNLIPQLLKARDMTITELQIKCGLGWPTIYGVATKEYIPDRTTVKTLNAVATALEVGISELFREEK